MSTVGSPSPHSDGGLLVIGVVFSSDTLLEEISEVCCGLQTSDATRQSSSACVSGTLMSRAITTHDCVSSSSRHIFEYTSCPDSRLAICKIDTSCWSFVGSASNLSGTVFDESKCQLTSDKFGRVGFASCKVVADMVVDDDDERQEALEVD
jgi:hypothetical protein